MLKESILAIGQAALTLLTAIQLECSDAELDSVLSTTTETFTLRMTLQKLLLVREEAMHVDVVPAVGQTGRWVMSLVSWTFLTSDVIPLANSVLNSLDGASPERREEVFRCLVFAGQHLGSIGYMSGHQGVPGNPLRSYAKKVLGVDLPNLPSS